MKLDTQQARPTQYELEEFVRSCVRFFEFEQIAKIADESVMTKSAKNLLKRIDSK